MTTVSDTRGVSGTAETACRLLESLWDAGQRPDVGQLVTEAGLSDAAGVARLLAIDQWRRWHSGERVPAEDYLKRFPQVAAEPEAALEVIYGELLVREELNEHPTEQEYLTRFPQWAQALQQQLHLHRNLDEDTPRSVDPLGSGTPTCLAGRGDAGQPLPVSPRYRSGRGDPSRYEVVRQYARGGLGEVFLARDTEVRRTVALKKIQPQFLDDVPSRGRFLREAEITGGLEHPGVVPVYGLGISPDGVPYYAMRFIKGETLQEAIGRFHRSGPTIEGLAERRLGLRSLVRRFVDVCNAVAYAHSRGVLHRDLKPANVMLSEYGQTLVIDWGLARVQGSAMGQAFQPAGSADQPECAAALADGEGVLEVDVDEAVLTQTGAAMGTPAYMSPEQAAGRLDLLGPASDIYSLGATLFVLLTGRMPVEGRDLRAILTQVERGDVRSPRQVRTDVPAALDAVCKKAMALRAADRYQSALDLAGDIEHWLADEPVSAYAEPVAARLARWSRRHRTMVTSVVAACGVAALALSLSTVWLAAVNRELEVANSAEAAARKEALEQEARAQENFRLARDSVNRYFTRVTENRRLKDAGLTSLRKELLDDAGSFFLSFISQRANDPTLEKELSQAYLQVARIEGETGNTLRAIERYKEAQAYLQNLAAAHPDNVTYQSDLARCSINLGQLSRLQGKGDDAEAYYRAALEKLEPLVSAYPDEAGVKRNLAGAYKVLGGLQRARAEYPAAAQSVDRARVLMEELAAAHPEVGEYGDALAGTWSNLGLIRRDQGNHQEAVTALQAALAVQEQLVKRLPEEDQYRNFLAAIHLNLGLAYESGDCFEEAEQAFVAALPLYQKVVARHPEVSFYREAQAMGLNELGRFYSDLNKSEQALATLNEALAIWRQLVARDEGVGLYASELARCLTNVGNLHFGEGRHADALPLQKEALALRAKLADTNPDVALYAVDLQNSQDNMGLVLEALHRFPEAETAFNTAVSINEKLAARYPKIPSHLSHLGHCQHHLGTLYLNTGNLARAEAAYRAAVQTRQKLAALAKSTPYYQYGLAETKAALANILSRLRQHGEASAQGRRVQEAEALFDAALPAMADLAAKSPDVVDYVSSLGDMYGFRGDHEERLGRHESAVRWYARAIETLAALRARNPRAERARGYLINALSGRAVALTRLGRYPEALPDWDEALKLARDAEKSGLRLGQAATVARSGDHLRAAAAADEQTKDPKISARLLFDAACVFALAGPAALRDAGIPSAERTLTADRYAARALELLGRARDLKFLETQEGQIELETVPDLEWLRNRPDFKRFRSGLKQK
jgi:serine/threonine-protein kinase